MYRGSSSRVGGTEPGPEGFITFGMNPVGIGPNSREDDRGALAKLKWLVVVENYETETATFWKAPKRVRRRRAASKIQTEVYLLPARGFAEKDGTFTNSARWLQWKWKALDPPGQAEDRPGDHRPALPRRARSLPEGGRRASRAGAQRLLGVHQPRLSRPRRGAEGDERQGARRHPRSEGQDQDAARPRASSSTASASSGTTAPRRAATGSTPASTPRPATTPSAARPPIRPASGCSTTGRFSWPANRRIMYNRASADAAGQALGPQAPGHRLERREVGRRRAGHQAGLAAGRVRRVHHAPRGRGPALHGPLNDGPFPEHYEPVEVAGRQPRCIRRSPRARSRRSSRPTRTSTARAKDFPIVCTTYRLTEHFHYWTKHTQVAQRAPAGLLRRDPGRRSRAKRASPTASR